MKRGARPAGSVRRVRASSALPLQDPEGVQTGVGRAEAREGPVLAEFGDQFDLYRRVERQHRNADGGTGVLACVTEDPAQQF